MRAAMATTRHGDKPGKYLAYLTKKEQSHKPLQTFVMLKAAVYMIISL